MRRMLIAGFIFLTSAIPSGSTAGTGYGQLVFQNNTSVAGDMYYDQSYACYAQARMMCPSMVRPGRYTVYAKYRDNTVSTSAVIEVEEGKVSTYTVTEAPAQ